MKRLILPTVFFYCCTFAALSPVRAFASSIPALSIIAETQIGETMVQELAVDRILKMVNPPKASAIPPFTVPTSATTALSGFLVGSAAIAGIAFYSRTGRDPVYAAASAVASAADALFVPAFQAFKANFVSPETYPASAAQYVGLEASVGSKVGDIFELAKSHPDNFVELNALLSSHTNLGGIPSSVLSGGTLSGAVLLANNGQKVRLTYTGSTGTDGSTLPAAYAARAIKFPLVPQGGCYSTGSTVQSEWHCFDGVTSYNGTWMKKLWLYSGTSTTDEVTLSPSSDSIDYPALKDALSNPSPAVANEIKEAIKDIPEDKKIVPSNPAPSSVPAPSQTAITNEQVNNFFTQNTSNVFNEYNNVANNVESTYNDIEGAKAAAELAKEQEEAEKKEETFPPIASSAFEEPYDPGPYDIPERFSSFLNTVKSSGLFSFSSSFFNSLPGGGSPVYQIEAGQYGSHTIDLSQTMSTGLAVLKTILLACFGFLSIRAVIMKR